MPLIKRALYENDLMYTGSNRKNSTLSRNNNLDILLYVVASHIDLILDCFFKIDLGNINLALGGKTKIQSASFCPKFNPGFSDDWDHLPDLMKKYYTNCSYSNNITRVK